MDSFITYAINIQFKQVLHQGKKLGKAEEGEEKSIPELTEESVAESTVLSVPVTITTPSFPFHFLQGTVQYVG